jgi:hypothetical protein
MQGKADSEIVGFCLRRRRCWLNVGEDNEIATQDKFSQADRFDGKG